MDYHDTGILDSSKTYMIIFQKENQGLSSVKDLYSVYLWRGKD